MDTNGTSMKRSGSSLSVEGATERSATKKVRIVGIGPNLHFLDKKDMHLVKDLASKSLFERRDAAQRHRVELQTKQVTRYSAMRRVAEIDEQMSSLAQEKETCEATIRSSDTNLEKLSRVVPISEKMEQEFGYLSGAQKVPSNVIKEI